MTLQDAYDDYLLEQRVRGNTAKTLEYYRNALGRFLAYAGAATQCDQLTLKVLRGYAVSLQEASLSTTTVQSYIRALRAFLHWGYEEEYLPADLPQKFRLPKAKRPTIDILTDEEVERLLGCFNLKNEIQLRNYCICSLMLDSGLRLNEVVTLTLDHLHLAEGYAIVEGKGNKERSVPFGIHTRKAMGRYLRRRPACAQSGRVFLQSNQQPITQTTSKQLFKKLKRRAGLPRLHPHLLRHTFATRYLENGGDMYSLRDILGHTSLTMVQKYVHLTQRKTIARYPDYSPLDKMQRSAG